MKNKWKYCIKIEDELFRSSELYEYNFGEDYIDYDYSLGSDFFSYFIPSVYLTGIIKTLKIKSIRDFLKIQENKWKTSCGNNILFSEMKSMRNEIMEILGTREYKKAIG